MANALGALFSDIANAIRGKTGNEGTMKPAEFPAAIDGIVMKADPVLAELTVSENGLYVPGEGVDGFNSVTVNVADSGADTEEIDDLLDEINGEFIAEAQYTFTFIGASGEVLCEVPVYDTQDCPDPITAGIISKPTKESTPQYSYAYSHWSPTDGGSADSSIFQNVTEDRTVYAVFTSTVRSYTISLYDGDELLKSYVYKYGDTPAITYAPEKYGFGFVGWEPEIATVTGDANYYAQWTEVVTFANGSWAEIAEISESGEAMNKFKIGETKEVTVTIDGIEEHLTLEIVGFNSVMLAGDVFAVAGMTIATKNLIQNKRSYSFKSASKSLQYWGNSELRDWCNNTVYNALPSEMKSAIKQVKIYSHNDANGASQFAEDYCWVPHLFDLGVTHTSQSGDFLWPDYVKYDSGMAKFETVDGISNIAPRKIEFADGTLSSENVPYLTRACSTGKDYVYGVDRYGKHYEYSHTKELNLLLGFCI